MTHFRLDVNKKTSETRLWMLGDCGDCRVPVIVWESIDGMKEFADMLLRWYAENRVDERQVDEVSENLLRQALGDDEGVQ